MGFLTSPVIVQNNANNRAKVTLLFAMFPYKSRGKLTVFQPRPLFYPVLQGFASLLGVFAVELFPLKAEVALREDRIRLAAVHRRAAERGHLRRAKFFQ